MNNDWFDLASVKPQENTSIWLFNPELRKVTFLKSLFYAPIKCTNLQWQYAVVPDPPKSKVDEDSDACQKYIDKFGHHTYHATAKLAWKAALDWERSKFMANDCREDELGYQEFGHPALGKLEAWIAALKWERARVMKDKQPGKPIC